MKIGILTQPLRGNYGGVLQNWALQQILIRSGHEPITIDILPRPSIGRFILSTIKSLLLWFILSRRRRFKRWRERRMPLFEEFVSKNIIKTPARRNYSMEMIREHGSEALLVGSDQTWCPIYSVNCLSDMPLHFVRNLSGKRAAYAVSSGADYREYSEKQTSVCSSLAQLSDAASVRETSGVALCERYLGIDAVVVLDPTLLARKEIYAELRMKVPVFKKRYLAAYVLDSAKEVDLIITEEAKKRGLPILRYSAYGQVRLTVEEWIAIFCDASFVITDSSHGTVFSIIFEKPFRCVANERRGGVRSVDLLEKYHSGKLEEWREKSLDFLREALNG